MKLYSIMPLLNDEYVGATCDDIEKQYASHVANEALFMMPLHPEGKPTSDKAAILCRKYDKYAFELESRGLKCGILAQSTIGHGAALTERADMQYVIALSDGSETYTVCPYDEKFRDYIRSAMATLAMRHPSTLMVDDDFRLFARGALGCTCPLHMREISRRAGYEITREELVARLNEDSEEARRLMDIFYDTQIDSLIGAAHAMREGIDSVDPSIQGAFCLCGDTCEGVAEIAKILAGKGNPIIIRLNNGRYTAPGARGISGFISRAAVQMSALDGKGDVFLAETDTCPQNRYSTAASSLHTHFTATILEGVAGCKHWITRTGSFEPQSGLAYRKKLSVNAGFYRELSRIVPSLDWCGCRLPLPTEPMRPTAPLSRFKGAAGSMEWAFCVLERLGLPMYFSSKDGGVPFLDGDADSFLSDEQVMRALSGTVFMSSHSASRLIRRGFGEYIGVSVRSLSDSDPKPRGEKIFTTGQNCSLQRHFNVIEPLNDRVEVCSEVYSMPDGSTQIPSYAGVTLYKNSLGGRAVVFAGGPEAAFNYVEAFSFLNESRKAQLISLLKDSGEIPVYYPDDAEVYVKAAKTSDGRLFCAFINIGLDTLDEIPLVVDGEVLDVEVLCPDGCYSAVEFEKRDGGRIVLPISAGVLEPVVLFVKIKE